MASAVRVLYPALADNWQMSAAQIGFLRGDPARRAAIGALTSGKLAHSARPGVIDAALHAGIVPRHWSVWPDADVDFRRGLSGAVRLVECGQLVAAIHNAANANPEAMLGRINGLWTAQNVTGDAIGAALLGGLGAMMTPVASASASGFGLLIIGVLLLLVLVELRHFRQTPPQVTASDS